MSFTEKIKTYAKSLGFDLVGVSPAEVPSPDRKKFFLQWLEKGSAGEMNYLKKNAEKRIDPRLVLPRAQSIISVGMNYFTDIPLRATFLEKGKGWISRYAWGDDYHDHLKEKLLKLLAFIKSESRKPVEGKVYVDTGPVLEREVGGRAGLGWQGKNTNLISRKIGSWFFLGEILLDVELTYDEPIPDFCGTCNRCIEACPTGAITEPYVLDPRRCISYLTIELKDNIPVESRPLLGNHIFGCDICQDVCPWNRKAPATSETSFLPREGLVAPSLLSLLRLGEEEFRTFFKKNPIKRVKRKGFLRNVVVALGNSRDPDLAKPLELALKDPEPLIRSHAVWALGQLGGSKAQQVLERALSSEVNPQVIEEIKRALEAM